MQKIMSVNETSKVKYSRIDLLKNKLLDLKEKKDLDINIKFELDFIKYRLENILESKKIKDINTETTYKFKKLGLYKKINNLDWYLLSLITEKQIIEISKLKISEFKEHYKKLIFN